MATLSPTPNTIFALATPVQPSPLAMMRLSGPLVPDIVAALIAASMRRASVNCRIALPLGQVPAMAWVLPGPCTLTGHDTLELFVPGNPAITKQLAARLTDLGCREAEPGEFTRRALEAGKLDLSSAQATLALVNAQSEAQRMQALSDLRGDTADALAALAERLRAISARFEMSFDFSEEEHARPEQELLLRDTAQLAADLAAATGPADVAPLRSRPEVVLFGPPNAGKSSLFNALLGQPRALVSAVPGTTRDPVEAECAFGSHQVLLVDLSGVGASDADKGRFSDAAIGRAAQADVVLVLEAPGQQLQAQAALQALVQREPSAPARAIAVLTMADAQTTQTTPQPRLEATAVSALSGAGLSDLRARVATRLDAAASGAVTNTLRTKAREALAELQGAARTPPEVAASGVRRALRLLDEALLSEAPGEVLDLIFSRFCIGK